MGIVLSDKQWNSLGRMLGGNSEYSDSLSGGDSTITLKRISDVQNSYLLTYNNNIEVEIHRYSEVSKYDLSYLHTLWNLWVVHQYPKELD